MVKPSFLDVIKLRNEFLKRDLERENMMENFGAPLVFIIKCLHCQSKQD